MRDVWHLLHRSLRAIDAMHPSAYDITILYPVGIATMDTHRTLGNKEKTGLSYSKQIHKAALRVKLSNINRTSDSFVTEGCGEIDTTIDKFTMNDLLACQSIVKFRSQETKLELLLILKQAYAFPYQSGYAVSIPVLTRLTTLQTGLRPSRQTA